MNPTQGNGKVSPLPSLPTGHNKTEDTSSSETTAHLPRHIGREAVSNLSDQPVTQRKVSEITNARWRPDWFEIKTHGSYTSDALRKKILGHCSSANKELSDLETKINQAMRGAKQGKNKIKKHQAEWDRLNISAGHYCIEYGHIDEALHYLKNARLALTSETDPKIAGDVHYGWFIMHHINGDHAQALDSLRQSMNCGHSTAHWEMTLIRIGLVDEYQTFCNPELAQITLQDLSSMLKGSSRTRKVSKNFLYYDIAAVGEVVEKYWAKYLTFALESRYFPQALDKIRYLLRDMSKQFGDENIDEAIAIHKKVVTFVNMEAAGVLSRLYQQHGVECLQNMSYLLRKLRELSSEPEASQKLFSKEYLENWFIEKGMSENEWGQLSMIINDPNEYKVIDIFLSMPTKQQGQLLDLAAIAHLKPKTSAKKLPYHLDELYKISEVNPRANQLLTAMAQSASQVHWARDSIRFFVGIDLKKNLEKAHLYAQCLKCINPNAGAFLTALCLREMKEENQFKTELIAITDEHPHPPSLMMLGDYYKNQQAGLSKEALAYYLKAGEAGVAAGYIKAAEMVMLQADTQVALWAVATAYYQQAHQLLARKGLAAEELHIPVKMNTQSGKREHLRSPKHCLS
ncbi:hypothetical protein ACH42_05445 [Endozoicomonas sp. (ex Bugula neritina AB1)]|nr:hypothetical protein ACH42_05445 [Endozoicomonas sp. (ex Bugula neritina AB1)]